MPSRLLGGRAVELDGRRDGDARLDGAAVAKLLLQNEQLLAALTARNTIKPRTMNLKLY